MKDKVEYPTAPLYRGYERMQGGGLGNRSVRHTSGIGVLSKRRENE